MASASWGSLSEDQVLRLHPKVVQGIWHPDGSQEAGAGSAWWLMLEGVMLSRRIPLLGFLPNPKGQRLKADTFGHLLEVLEDAQVVGQVRGQDDVPHQVQHALIVLGAGREMSWPPARHPHPFLALRSLHP